MLTKWVAGLRWDSSDHLFWKCSTYDIGYTIKGAGLNFTVISDGADCEKFNNFDSAAAWAAREGLTDRGSIYGVSEDDFGDTRTGWWDCEESGQLCGFLGSNIEAAWQGIVG